MICRRRHLLIKVLGITVLALLMLVSIAGAPISVSNSSKWVSGYYTGYNSYMLPPQDIYWPGLTQIVMGTVLANPDGSLDTTFYLGPKDGPFLAQQISTLAHQNHKKALLQLGGWENGANIASAIQNNQSLFISNLLNVMNTYGYDGFDLDWEDSINYTQFVSFAHALRTAAPTGTILTLPVECINPNYQTVDTNISKISQYMDEVNLMSYYPGTMNNVTGWYSWFNSPLKGEKYNTPISIEDSLSRYNASGIPNSKLGMGISFYAVGYAGTPTITGPDQPVNPTYSFVGGDNIYPLSTLFGTSWANDADSLHWSDEAVEPYLSLPSPDWSGARYLTFETPQSIIEKGNFTRDNGYGGIIIWTINQGYVSTNSDPNFLMEAVQTGFLAPVVYNISPASGTTLGGTNITITGTGFNGTSAVNFGSVPATNVKVVNMNTINATAPAETAGTVDVTVTTFSGTSAVNQTADQFTYQKNVVPITWSNPADIVYGTKLSSSQPAATASVVKLSPAHQLDATSSVPGTFTYNPPAGTVLGAGSGQTLSTIFTPIDITNYTTTSASVFINVTKATSTILWGPANITYGIPLSSTQLDAIARDFVGEIGRMIVRLVPIPGSFVYNPPTGTVLSVGEHTLTAIFTPTDTANYTTPIPKTVSINVMKATPTITWKEPEPISYGTRLSSIQLDAMASVPGSFVYTPATGTVLRTGKHILKVSFTPKDTTNYTTASASVLINVYGNFP
jgi:chitinase